MCQHIYVFGDIDHFEYAFCQVLQQGIDTSYDLAGCAQPHYKILFGDFSSEYTNRYGWMIAEVFVEDG